jgi:hypothetical protein
MKSLEKLIQQKWFSYAFFGMAWAIVFILYFPARDALLIDDGISGLWELKTEGLKGFLKSYGFDSFYYGHYSILALLYALFGLNPLGWFIVFTAMHALNASMIFSACKKVYQHLQLGNQALWISLLGAILFLLSPYMSENIIWGATSHYFATMSILWLSINWLANYIPSSQKSFSIYLFHGLFAFALLTLEISFLFPVVFAMLFLLFLSHQKNSLSIVQYLLTILLPQIALVGIYLLCYKWTVGTWIPHDRAPLEASVSKGYMVTTLSQQFSKVFGFVHFFDFKTREWFYSLLIHWKKTALILSVLFTITSTWIFIKDKSKLLLSWFLLFIGLLMYAPFVRVYFMYLMRFENDRYAYFASAFLLQYFVLVLFQVNKWIRGIVYILFLSASIYFVFPAVKARQASAHLHATFLKKFPENTIGKTYIMNMPTYCADTYVFRARTRFPIAYEAIFGVKLFDHIQTIAWYNAQTEKDTFEVKKTDPLHYEIILKTNGSWWMQQAIGASNYENDDYTFTLGEWGNYYLEFKHPLSENDALIYFNGNQFVKMN